MPGTDANQISNPDALLSPTQLSQSPDRLYLPRGKLFQLRHIDLYSSHTDTDEYADNKSYSNTDTNLGDADEYGYSNADCSD